MATLYYSATWKDLAEGTSVTLPDETSAIIGTTAFGTYSAWIGARHDGDTLTWLDSSKPVSSTGGFKYVNTAWTSGVTYTLAETASDAGKVTVARGDTTLFTLDVGDTYTLNDEEKTLASKGTVTLKIGDTIVKGDTEYTIAADDVVSQGTKSLSLLASGKQVTVTLADGTTTTATLGVDALLFTNTTGNAQQSQLSTFANSARTSDSILWITGDTETLLANRTGGNGSDSYTYLYGANTFISNTTVSGAAGLPSSSIYSSSNIYLLNGARVNGFIYTCGKGGTSSKPVDGYVYIGQGAYGSTIRGNYQGYIKDLYFEVDGGNFGKIGGYNADIRKDGSFTIDIRNVVATSSTSDRTIYVGADSGSAFNSTACNVDINVKDSALNTAYISSRSVSPDQWYKTYNVSLLDYSLSLVHSSITNIYSGQGYWCFNSYAIEMNASTVTRMEIFRDGNGTLAFTDADITIQGGTYVVPGETLTNKGEVEGSVNWTTTSGSPSIRYLRLSGTTVTTNDNGDLVIAGAVFYNPNGETDKKWITGGTATIKNGYTQSLFILNVTGTEKSTITTLSSGLQQFNIEAAACLCVGNTIPSDIAITIDAQGYSAKQKEKIHRVLYSNVDKGLSRDLSKIGLLVDSGDEKKYFLKKTDNKNLYIVESPIYYSAVWFDKKDGETVTVNGIDYTIGTNAFGSYKAAKTQADANAESGAIGDYVQDLDLYYGLTLDPATNLATITAARGGETAERQYTTNTIATSASMYTNAYDTQEHAISAHNSMYSEGLVVIDRTGMADIGEQRTFLKSTSSLPYYLRNYIASNSLDKSVLASALDTATSSGCNVIVGEGSTISQLVVGERYSGVTTGDCRIAAIDGGRVGALYIGTLYDARLGDSTGEVPTTVTVNVIGEYDDTNGYTGSRIGTIYMTDSTSGNSVYADVTINLKDTSGTSIYCGSNSNTATTKLEGNVSITLDHTEYTRIQNYSSSTSYCTGEVSLHVTGGKTSTVGTLYLDNTNDAVTIDGNSCLTITSNLRDGKDNANYTKGITIDTTGTDKDPALSDTTVRHSVFHSTVSGLVGKLNFKLNQEGDDNYILRKTKTDVYIEERPVLYSYAWSLLAAGTTVTWQGEEYTIGTDAFASYAAAAAAVAEMEGNKPHIETADTYYSPDWAEREAGEEISGVYGASTLAIGVDAYTTDSDAKSLTGAKTAYVLYNKQYSGLSVGGKRTCDFTATDQCVVYNSCSIDSAAYNSGIVTNQYGGIVQLINCSFTQFDGYGGTAKVDKSYTQIIDASTVGTLYASQVSSSDTLTLKDDGSYSWDKTADHSTVTQKIINGSQITNLQVGGYATVCKGEFYVEVSKSSVTNLTCSGVNNGNQTLGNISITLADATIGKLIGYAANESNHHVSITVTGKDAISSIGTFEKLKTTDTLTIDSGATLVFGASSGEFNSIHSSTNNGTLYLTGSEFIKLTTTASTKLVYLNNGADSTIKVGTFDSSTKEFTESSSVVASVFNDTKNEKQVTYTVVSAKQQSIYICSNWEGKDVESWYNAAGDTQSSGVAYKYGVNGFASLSQVSNQLAAGGTIYYLDPAGTPTVLEEDTTVSGNADSHGKMDVSDHPLEANGNELTLNYMDVTGNVYGGSSSGSTKATSVTLDGSSITGVLYGGSNADNDTGTSQQVTIRNASTVTGNIFGGSNGGNATATSVNISGGSTVTGLIYGGSSNGNTGNSTVTVADSTLNKGVYGGSRIVDTGTGEDNKKTVGAIELSVSNTTVASGRMIYGGGVVSNGEVTITGDITATLTGINTGNDDAAVSYYGGGNFQSGTLNVKGSISTTINSGKFKNVFSGANVSSSAAATGNNCVVGDTSLTISGGKFSGVVGNGSATSTVAASQGASALTITGGEFSDVVYAGGFASDKVAITAASTTLAISGGTFHSLVAGGNGASKSSLSTGNITYDVAVTVDTSTNTVTFKKNLIAGSMGAGQIGGSTSITFTGLGSKLSFAEKSYVSGCSEYARIDDHGEVVSYVTGTQTLAFDGFTGSFGGNVNQGFSNITLTKGSKVTFAGKGKNDLSRVGEWDLQLSSADAAIVFNGDDYKNDFTGDTIRLSFDDETLGDSAWTVFDGNDATITGWNDESNTIYLGNDATKASFTEGAWKSEHYMLSLDTETNALKLARRA